MLHRHIGQHREPLVKEAFVTAGDGLPLSLRHPLRGAIVQALSDDDAAACCAEIEARMGLPTVDPFRQGADRLVDALETMGQPATIAAE